MERELKVKVSEDAPCYCSPRSLLAVVNDLQCQAGQRHTIIAAYHQHGVRWPGNRTRFAVIWIRRMKREYKLILCRYSIVTGG